VQILGAVVGFLIGSYLADYIGRKGTFVWLAVASFVIVLVFLLVPMDNTALFWLGIPLKPPMGPFMTERTRLRFAAPGRAFATMPGVLPAPCFRRWSGI